MRRSRYAALSGAVGLMIGLAACSAPPVAGSGTGSPAPPAGSGPPTSAAVATSAGAPTTASRPVLATGTIPLAPEYGGGTLTFSVVSLSVRAQLTALELEVRADGDLDAGRSITQVVGRPDAARALAPELIDAAHLKAYSEVDNGIGITDIGVPSLSDGVPTVLTFYYAAPRDAVTTFDVAIGSGLPTLRDVPLSR